VNETDSSFTGLEVPPPNTERPSPIPGVTWGWRDLVLGVVAALLVFLVLSALVVGSTIAAFGDNTLETMLAEAVAIAMLDVILVGAVILVVARKGAGLTALGLRPPTRGWPRLVGVVFLAYFAAIGIVNIYGILIQAFGLNWLEPGDQLGGNFYDHKSVVILTGIAIIFMAPVAEEIFFRGFIYGGLRRYLNLPVAGLISGLLFAFAHGDLGLVLPFAGVGLVLAYVYERSGSLYASIGMHFVFNSISFMLLLLVPEWR
jgi:CAAX protease family protein